MRSCAVGTVITIKPNCASGAPEYLRDVAKKVPHYNGVSTCGEDEKL